MALYGVGYLIGLWVTKEAGNKSFLRIIVGVSGLFNIIAGLKLSNNYVLLASGFGLLLGTINIDRYNKYVKGRHLFLIILIIGIITGYAYYEKMELKDECIEWNNFAIKNSEFAVEDSYELQQLITDSTYRINSGNRALSISRNADTKELKNIGERLQKDSDDALLNLQQYPTSPQIAFHIKEEKEEYELMLRDFKRAGEHAVNAAEYWEVAIDTCDYTDNADYTYVDLAHDNLAKAKEYSWSGNDHHLNALSRALETSLSFYGYDNFTTT